MERDDHAEILRARERLHTLENVARGNKWSIDDLREWRAEVKVQMADLSRRLDEAADVIGGLVTAAEIAEAVAEKMKGERQLALTFVQKAGAACLGGASLAAILHGLGVW